MRRALAISLFLVAVVAMNAFAVGEARFTGIVQDTDGKPLADVTLTVTSASQAKNFKQTFKTRKDGRFQVFVLDGTIPYKFTFTKEGYGTAEETIKLRLVPEKNERTVTLVSGEAAAAAAAAQETAGADPAVLAYNEGVDLVKAGKDAEATVKFEEAVAANPKLTVGHMALAKVNTKAKNWKRAVDAANVAVALSGDDDAMYEILAEGYEALGDKAKAAEFRKKAPANPGALFNEAARLINSQKDGEAIPLLEQAIAADETFAVAHYELGMCYARAGKNADAKTHLQRYLELEPNGKDAAVAKDMLNYIK